MNGAKNGGKNASAQQFLVAKNVKRTIITGEVETKREQ